METRLNIKINFLKLFLLFFFLNFRLSAIELNDQSNLYNLAVVLLSESEFQDCIRENNYLRASVSFEKIEKLILSISKLPIIDANIKKKLIIKSKEIKTSLKISGHLKKIENDFNEIIKLLYQCYYFFPITDSPEINYFLVDIFQFENYLKKQQWDLMLTECNEMLDFFESVAIKIRTVKTNRQYNNFLLKYFNISLLTLKNAVSDKDINTLKISINQFKEIILNFQNIYSSNNKFSGNNF